jgi:putative ABC transport system permease protein
MILTITGALIGAGLARLVFNGLTARPLGFQFQLAVTPSLALLGIGWALCMGLIGGLIPAVRASRVSATVALRAT